MNVHHEHKVTEDEQGMRLDVLLANLGIEGIVSRSAAARMIESALVLVNGEITAKKRIVVAGDAISIEVPPRSGAPSMLKPAPNIPLDIRFEDRHLIVLSKQAGLVVHPAKRHYDDTLANALVAHCGIENLGHVQGEDRPGIVHRLDMDTSGLMLAGKTDVAAARLQDDIRRRVVDRRYLALVHGNIAPDSAKVDAPLARHNSERLRMVVSNDANAKDAITTFRVLERFEARNTDTGYTLLECHLFTGRTHQIRAHMAYIKHPVVGDPLYGRAACAKAKHREAAIRSEFGLERQFLHSWRLSFIHPITGKEMSFQDSIPFDLAVVLDNIADRSTGRTKAGKQLLETQDTKHEA